MTDIQNAVQKYLATQPAYKGEIVAVQAAAGKSVGAVALTIQMQPAQVPNTPAELTSLENALKKDAQAAVNSMQPPVTVESVDVKPASAAPAAPATSATQK